MPPINPDLKHLSRLPSGFYRTLFFRVFRFLPKLFSMVPTIADFRYKLLAMSNDEILSNDLLPIQLEKQINISKNVLRSLINIPQYHRASNTIVCRSDAGITHAEVFDGTDSFRLSLFCLHFSYFLQKFYYSIFTYFFI